MVIILTLIRSQVVRFNGCFAQACDSTSGFTQASLLGPLLLLLCINDIFRVILHDTLFRLASDIKIVYSVATDPFDSTLALIKEELKSLDNWRSKWHMNCSIDWSSLVKCRWHADLNFLFIIGLSTFVSHMVKELKLEYSCSFNVHRQAHEQTAAAKNRCNVL